MKSSEGRLGRIFFLRLENGDNIASIERFALENGIGAGQVFVLGTSAFIGIILLDADGKPGVRISADAALPGQEYDVVIQEVLGVSLQRVTDPASGQETLASVRSTKTRVMEKAAPVPDGAGPGTIPVYLFNAEFN